MSMKDRTKRMFADELEKMLGVMPFESVRVKELAKRCEATPQAFYYHFKDKYELAAWIFLQDIFSIMREAPGDDIGDSVAAMNQKMNERRIFYKKVFNDKSQNNIEAFIYDFNNKYSVQAVMRHEQTDQLTEEQLLAIKYHSYGVQGLLREWIYGKIEIDLRQLSAFQIAQAPDFLRNALEDFDDVETLEKLMK